MSSIDEAKNHKEVVKSFATETTMHGLKFLFARGIFRNVIWLMLLIGSCVLVYIQVYQQLNKYLDHEISTQIDFNYPSSLPFPSVMICNSNMYRISKVIQYAQLYEMLSDIWNRKHNVTEQFHPPNFAMLYKTVLSNLTISFHNDSSLFTAAFGHNISDMLLSCITPAGLPCNASNFKPVMTDMGLCYVFNDTLEVSKAGSSNAFQLMLNLQEYESMPGPSPLLSIKVLFYDSSDYANPSRNAIDIAPGYMSVFGLKYVTEERITSCVNEKATKHFSKHQYSAATCTLDAVYLGIEASCHCSPHYAPKTDVPACKIEDYLDCVMFFDTTQYLLPALTQNLSTCNESCSMDGYTNSLAMAKIATSLMNRLEGQFETAMMKDFNIAMEASSRKDMISADKMKTMINNVQMFASEAVKLGLWPNVTTVEPIREKLKAHSSSYTSFSETFSALSSNLNPSPAGSTGSSTGCPCNSSSDMTSNVIINASNVINGYKMIMSTQQKNLFEVDYDENTNLVIDVFNGWQLWQSILRNPSSQFYSINKDNYKALRDMMNDIVSYTNSIITKYQWSLNEIKYSSFPNTYGTMCKDYIHTVAEFLNVLQNLKTDNMTQSIFAHLNETDIENSQFWLSVNYASTAANQYPVDLSQCKSKNTWSTLIFLAYIFADSSNSNQCCSMIMGTNVYYYSFFKFLNENLNQLIEETNSFNDYINSACVEIPKSFSILFSDLEHYIDKWDWGYDFYSNNFLGITVYFAELSQQIITQSQPYDFFSLICDIGGTLGLFLGASILTFFEVIDMIIFGICAQNKNRVQ